MFGFEDETSKKKVLPVQIYGVSGGSIKKEIEAITGVNPGNNAVYTRETGRVAVTPEIFITGGDCVGCDGGGGGAGDGDAALFCILVVIALFVVFATVWVVVMIAFSIMTFGGFIRKRYRTVVLIEKENLEFIGKLAIFSVRKGGVLRYPLGQPDYDDWVEEAFRKFNLLKIIRQVSLLLGFLWGFTEVAFKLYELILAEPGFSYNLWPLRYVMVVIFVPLLLFSPILEFQIRNAFEVGEDMIERLINREPMFNPDQPMMFEEEPLEVGKISTDGVKSDLK
ncbi:MAG: hypothetical protein ACFFE2_12150 [Candidatus Thorarchaeota archaeon]